MLFCNLFLEIIKHSGLSLPILKCTSGNNNPEGFLRKEREDIPYVVYGSRRGCHFVWWLDEPLGVIWSEHISQAMWGNVLGWVHQNPVASSFALMVS